MNLKIHLILCIIDVKVYLPEPVEEELVSPPLLRRRLNEQVPYGINMVNLDGVPDTSVGNRKVCIVDSGYEINHPDLPSPANNSPGTITGTEGGAGPWTVDRDGHGEFRKR